MTELLTAAQMRAIEEAAIASGEVTGLELMERAGRGVVEAIFEEWPELARTSHRAVVLCGPGNNGGDGFVVARLLKEWGWEVEAFLYGDPEKLPPDARVNYERWLALGDVAEVGHLYERHGWDSETNLCFEGEAVTFVDAAFGTGLVRPLDEDLSNFLSDARDHSLGKVVAIDVPSGHCADSGKALVFEEDTSLQFARYVDLTVMFHRAKQGALLSSGAEA
ncbi:MAG: NAD(P)H-hydrate epimerase, partial [Paracoccaceae bacterium]